MTGSLMAAMPQSTQLGNKLIKVLGQPGARQARLPSGFAPPLTTICLLVIALLPVGAAAQLTEPLLPVPSPPSGPQAPAVPGQPTYAGQTVTDRPRPELDPIGMRFGDFFWFPRAGLSEIYNSNIFATQNLTKADLITSVEPAFELLSSFPRHALNIRAGSVSQFYAVHPDQDTQDGFLDIGGHLDVTGRDVLSAAVRAEHLHIPRTSPDSPGNAAQPVTYNVYTANAGYSRSGLRFGYSADIAISNSQYNSVPLVGGGTLPQSAQDLTYSQAALRGNYELIPDYVGYVRVSGNLSEYQHTVPGGVRFNSKGYRADVGLQILPRHIIYGEVYAGYLSQIYDIGGSLGGVDFGGRLIYNITPLTTATFKGLRTVVPSNPLVLSSGNAYFVTTVTGIVDHELLRNLLTSAALGYTNYSYLGISRTDNILSATIGVKYLANRNLYLGAAFTYQQQNSTIRNGSYAQNILMLRAGTQF